MQQASTITVQIPAQVEMTSQVGVLSLRSLQKKVEEQVDQLIHQILEDAIFSAQSQEAVQEWHANFKRQYLEGMGTDAKQTQAAALALCYFLSKFVYTAVGQTIDFPVIQDRLLHYEVKIEEILKLLIPSVEIGEFIKIFEGHLDEETILKEKIQKTATLHREQMVLLYASANKMNEEITRQFEILKQRLLNINAKRKTMNAELNKELDCQAEKIEQMMKELMRRSQEIQATAEKMKRQEQAYGQKINALRNLVKKG